MVSRLKFKGDKSPIGVQKPKRVERKKKVDLSNLSELESDHQIHSEWISAESLADLKGPLVLAFHDTDLKTFFVNNDGLVTSTTDFGLATHSLQNYTKGIHRIEPNRVEQVFIASPVLGATKDRSKFALKSSEGKYLTASRGTVKCNSEAIGQGQIWEFEEVSSNDGVFFRLHNDNQILKHDGSLASDADDLFVGRVQLASSATGKKLLADLNPADNTIVALQKAIDSLRKDEIEISEGLIERLQTACVNGRINEQLIIERQTAKSDSRC